MKQKYQAPHIDIIKVENEGVMANSIGDLNNGGWSSSPTSGSSGAQTPAANSTLSEIEDLINDILTY